MPLRESAPLLMVRAAATKHSQGRGHTCSYWISEQPTTGCADGGGAWFPDLFARSGYMLRMNSTG